MKRFLSVIAILATAFMAFTACEEEGSGEITISDEASKELFDNGISFASTPDGGKLSATLSFDAPSPWSATVGDAAETKAEPWLNVDPASGPAGPATITVTAQENTGDEDRSAVVTITSGDLSLSFNVSQQANLQQKPSVTVELDKQSAQMSVGETLELLATVLPDQEAVWFSSNENVATVAGEHRADVVGTYINVGTVTAVGEGEAIITAKVGDTSAQCVITVVANGEEGRLIITPDKVTILKNEKLQLSVTDEKGNAVKATWSTTDNIVAVVDENNVLEARNPGSAVVTATADGKTGTCEVTVEDEVGVQSIAFDPDYIEMNIGDERQLEVVFTPENATHKHIDVWAVDGGNPAVTVDDKGVVKAVKKGTAVVVAGINYTNLTARCTIKVIDPDNPDIPVESLVIEPAPVTLAVDEEKILTAVMQPSDANVTVEWKCDNPNIIALGSISKTQAKIQGLSAGKTTVTAYAGGKTATCEVTVEGSGQVAVTSITLNKTQLEMTVGQTETLVATVLPENATDKALNWSVRDNRIVSVSASGEITALSVGSTTVTVISVKYPSVMASCQVTVRAGGGGSSTLRSVSIDPSSVTLSLNEEKALSLILDPADAEVTIYWESSNSSIAKVQMTSKLTAKVQGLAAGHATLTAHAGDLTATCEVTVQSGSTVPVQSVTLNAHELQLSVGQQFQLVATVLPENATEKGVVWSSNVQSSKLYIDTNGMVSGLQECEATVTVRSKDNAYIYDTCKITVTGGSSSTEEFVDLGLPSGLKWRTMNVGASKPEDYGNYYAWAETSPKSSYTSSNYKYPATSYGDGITIYKKYDTTPGGDGKTVLEAEDDAATANLGNGWRMPTFKEFKELRENCTWTWKTQNGVNGMLVTGPNGKSIFLPAGGWYSNSTLNSKGSYGSYWTATGDGGTANAVDFINGDKDKALVPRYEGRSVRPVKD